MHRFSTIKLGHDLIRIESLGLLSMSYIRTIWPNRAVSTAHSSGPKLSLLSISKATVSLSVGFATAGDTASVSEMANISLFTALDTCTVEPLIAHLSSRP